MATWTAPTTRSTAYLVTASDWNTDIVENLKYLKDSPTFAGAITITTSATSPIYAFTAGHSLIGSTANIVELRGGTSAQALYIDETYTDASNYERLRIRMSGSNQAIIETISAGTGSNLSMILGTVDAGTVTVKIANTNRWQWDTSGHYVAVADNTYDIGASGATRPRTVYVGTNVVVGGDAKIAATGKLYLDGGGDTYAYESSANRVYHNVGGSTMLVLQNDGTKIAGFDNTDAYLTAAKKFYLNGPTTNTSYIYNRTAATVTLVSNTQVLELDATGLAMPATNPTSASAANCVIADGDYLRRSTSSVRYKHDIASIDADQALATVKAMRPVTYRGKTDTDQRRYVGFIAEEVAAIDPLLCTYDEGGEAGTPNYVTYDRVTAVLVAAMQRLEARLAAIEKAKKAK